MKANTSQDRLRDGLYLGLQLSSESDPESEMNSVLLGKMEQCRHSDSGISSGEVVGEGLWEGKFGTVHIYLAWQCAVKHGQEGKP